MTHSALGIHSLPIRRLLGMPPRPLSKPGGLLHRNKVAPAPTILPPLSGPKTLAKTTKEAVDRYPTVYALAARTKAAYTLPPKHPDPFRKTWDALNPTEPLEMKRLLKAVETEEARLLKATFYEVEGNSESLRESPEYKGLQAARELGLGVHPSAQKSIDQVMTPGNMGETPGFNVFNERNIRIWGTAVTAHKRVYRDIATETQAIVAAARRELAATRDRLMWLNPRMRDELTVQIKAFTKATEAITTDINRKPFQNLKTARKRREELNAAVATWMIADSKNADALDAANGVLNALNIVSRPGFVRLTFDNPQKRVIIHDTNSGVPRRAAQLREVLDTVRKIKQSPAPTDKELTLLRKSLAELPRLSANLKREADKLRNALATEPTFSGAQEREKENFHKAVFPEMPPLIGKNRTWLLANPTYKKLLELRASIPRTGVMPHALYPIAQPYIDAVLDPENMGPNDAFNWNTLMARKSALIAKEAVEAQMEKETQAIIADVQRRLDITEAALPTLPSSMRYPLKEQIAAFTQARAAITEDPKTQTAKNLQTALACSQALTPALVTVLLADPQNTQATQTAIAKLRSFKDVYDVAGLARHTLRDTPRETLIAHDSDGTPTSFSRVRELLIPFNVIQKKPEAERTEADFAQLQKILPQLPGLNAQLQKDQALLLEATLPEIIGRRAHLLGKITANKKRLSADPSYQQLLRWRSLPLGHVPQSAQKCMDRILNPGDIGQKTLPENFNETHMLAMQRALEAQKAVRTQMKTEIAAIIADAKRHITKTNAFLDGLTPAMTTKLGAKIKAFTEARDRITPDKTTQTPENFEAVLRQIQALTHAVTQPEKGMTETEIRTLENFHAVLHAGLPLLSPRRMLSGPREAGESHDAWATLKKIGQTHPSQITDAQLRQLRDIRTKHLELSDTLYTTAMTAIQNNSRLFLNAHKERHAWRQLTTGVSPRAKAESDQALATAAMGEDLRPEMLTSADIRAMQNTRPYTDVSGEIAEEIAAIRISARTIFQTTQAQLTDLSPETQTQFRDQIRAFTRAMARLKTTPTLESFQTAWACCQACHASALKSLSTVSAPDPTPPPQDVLDTYPRPSAQRRDVMRATARRERIRHICEQQQTIAQALDDSPYFDGHTGSRKSMDSLTAHYYAQIQSFLAVLRSKDLPTEPISERTLDAITNTQREALEAATAAAKYLATITSERQADMRKSFAQLRDSGRRPSPQAVALSVQDAARRMWAELAQHRQLSSDDHEI